MTISVTLRGTKGSALTYQEVDANFSNIKTAVDAVDASLFVTTSTAQSITGAKTFTANTALKGVQETVYAWGNVSAGTYTIDCSSGTIHSLTLTGNVTISSFTNVSTGQSVTIKLKQDATGSRTLTSTMKFAGGSKTLTTSSNAIDVISVLYDGTDYLASLVKGFA